MAKRLNNAGFTFIEVLVAMLILVLAALAASNIGNGAVRATKDAKEMSRATWLVQNVMTEAETRLETEGIDKACDKKKEGKFDAPNEAFTYAIFCNEIDFRLSETAAQVAAAAKNPDDKGGNDPTHEDLIKKMVLDMASDYISKSIRELHVEVYWNVGKQKRKVSLTTHVAKYDTPLTMPGAGGASQ